MSKPLNKHDEKWGKMFHVLKKYHEETGEWPKTNAEVENKKIGAWLTQQKKNHQQNKLKNDRAEKIKKLGYPLDESLQNLKWDETLELLKEYHAQIGNWPIQSVVYKNKRIGMWLNIQKMNYKNNSLSADRLQKLIAAGVPVQEDTHEKQWNHMFELLKQYHEETDIWPSRNVTIENENLGTWFNNQRYLGRKQKLPDDRQEKLESIGVVFEKDKTKK